MAINTSAMTRLAAPALNAIRALDVPGQLARLSQILEAPLGVFGHSPSALGEARELVQSCFQQASGQALTKPEDLRALMRLDMELHRSSLTGDGLEAERRDTLSGLQAGTIAPRKIPSCLLHITEGGGIVFLGTPGEDGKPRNIVLRPVPWVTKEIFPICGATLYVAAGLGLDIGTGRHHREPEFIGYRARFIDGREGNIVCFNDETDDVRGIVATSYLGASWHVRQATIAKLYPPVTATDPASVLASKLIPDLHAEALQLQSPFPLEGDRGLWKFYGIERGGHMVFEDWDLVNAGPGRWSLLEGGIYVGEVDLKDHPLPVKKSPFMADVLNDPESDAIRFEAMVLGKPTVLSAGGGSGFTKEKSNCRILIDARGDVWVRDPGTEIVDDLRRLGIHPSRVKYITVSHGHFDHCGGLWQLIRALPYKPELIIHYNDGDLEKIREGRIGEPDEELSTLMALLQMAFKDADRKVEGAKLLDAVNLRPMKFLQPMDVGTFKVQFFHTNHSNPTTGDIILNPETGLPVYLFTGDTRLDINDLLEAVRAGAMTPERMLWLASLPMSILAAGGIVDGDAGVRTLHPTPDFYLRMLATMSGQGFGGPVMGSVRENTVLGHCAETDAQKVGLPYIGFGWKSAIDLSAHLGWTRPTPGAVKDRLLQQELARIPLFANLTTAEIQNLLSRDVQFTSVERNTVLMRQGDESGEMFLVLDGTIDVTTQHGDTEIHLGSVNTGLLGEAAFVPGMRRNATARTRTSALVARFGAPAIHYLREIGVAAKALDLRGLRALIDGSDGKVPILDDMEPMTRDSICLAGSVETAAAGQVLIEEGMAGGDLFFIIDGQVSISAASGPLHDNPVTLGRGGVVGEGALFGQGGVRIASVTALEPVSFIRLPAQKARRLLEQSGGDLHYYLLGLVQRRKP